MRISSDRSFSSSIVPGCVCWFQRPFDRHSQRREAAACRTLLIGVWLASAFLAGPFFGLGGVAEAQEMVVQNDSIVNLGAAAIQAGFVAQEEASAWLTSPCNGNITKVQVFWLSISGASGNTLGEAIRIYEAGTFPTPGPILQDLAGPLMTDGAINEFTLPVVVPVTSGQTFVTAFKFFETPPATGPSVVNDTDGCQASKNGIFAIPPSIWFDSCLLGVSGDFGIRAVVNCGSTTIFEDGFESGDTLAWTATIP